MAVVQQDTEMSALLQAISETRETIARTSLERDQVIQEKGRLLSDAQKSSKLLDSSKQRRANTALEDIIGKLKGEQAGLKAQVENLTDELEGKKNLLQMRENEVRLMNKELEKWNKQKSILLDKCKPEKVVRMPSKSLASKSQVDSFLKESLNRGMQKESIRPFTSFNFSLNMFQSTGPIKVPSGLNTSRSSVMREAEAPSTKRKAAEVKSSSPSVE